jgi:hypothetical protein
MRFSGGLFGAYIGDLFLEVQSSPRGRSESPHPAALLPIPCSRNTSSNRELITKIANSWSKLVYLNNE